MKSSIITQLMNNYSNQHISSKDIPIKKVPTQTSQKLKKKGKNKNEKDIYNPSIKNRRNPRSINTKKSYFAHHKKNKSYSRKKNKNIQNNKFRLINQQKANINRTICTDGYGNIVNAHDRNLSAPSLNYPKNHDKKIFNWHHKNIKKKKNNNIKINLRNKSINDDNIINKDNNVHIDFNSVKDNKDNNDNLITNDDKFIYRTCDNNEQNDPKIFYKYKNNDENNSLITIKPSAEDNNNNISTYKNIKNFYKNYNNNKPIRNINYKIDLSGFNKDIEIIKNTRETIALLKEQLKMKDNYYYYQNYYYKPKLNKTINVINPINIEQLSNTSLNKKKICKNYNKNNKKEYYVNNYSRDYNHYSINKNDKSNINTINTTNPIFNDSNLIAKDLTPNRQVSYTTRDNNSNVNLTNSSNNKTVTISTNITNNNNNGFGKNINLSNVFGGHNDKDEKEIKDINKDNNINNDDLNTINHYNDDKIINENNGNENKNKYKEDVICYKNNHLDNNCLNDINNKEDIIINNDNFNIIKINKNNNDNNKKLNYLYLQKLCKPKDSNNLNKNINNVQLNVKNKNYYVLLSKEKAMYKNKLISKNNYNKIIDINPFSTKFNTINNERYNNFNIHTKNKKEHNRNNISYDMGNKNKANFSKIKLTKVSKSKDRYSESGSKKKKLQKLTIIKNKSIDKSTDSYEKVNRSSGNAKKYSTKLDYNQKSIYKVGVICEGGEVVFGEKKTNQDNYFDYSINNDMRFIGVCDGHGEYGHYVSQYLREYLPKQLEKKFRKVLKKQKLNLNLLQKEMSGDCSSEIKKTEENQNVFEKIKKIFEKSFSKTDKSLSSFCQYVNKNNIGNSQDEAEESVFDIEYSGSTCVSILLKEKNIKKIYVANVGDSRVIIIKELNNQNRDWIPLQLSRDHKPTEEDEAQRILEYDGEIEKIEDDDGNWTGPLRVWVKGSDGPGLAMTRSFGDEVGASVGVISVPEVSEYKVKDEDRAIIIASDGLWEYMDNKDVTEKVKKLIDKNDPNLIANELYKESVNRWKLKDQGIDDITIICVLLKND